jgi:hypothetical protein
LSFWVLNGVSIRRMLISLMISTGIGVKFKE